MKIAISTDSALDLTKEYIDKYSISVVPFSVLLGNETKLDANFDTQEIFDYVDNNKTLPKTSAVNVESFIEHFNNLKKDYDEIIHISLSSEMSSAYNNALLASKDVNGVYVIDSRTLSTGISLLAIYAKKLVDSGLPANLVVEKIMARIPYVQASFELKRVDYLYKGGRCSAMQLLGANILRIRPQIIVKDGKMISGNKYRGNMEHVVDCYVRDVLEKYDNPDLSVAFITYSTATEEMVEIARARLKDAGFKEIIETRAGATVASHCGEMCLGVLYINDGEHII
ncbi:MAG: DegV family protein [Clostridia bacterium]|nr:DegV family protein [Clostridia bacterium]